MSRRIAIRTPLRPRDWQVQLRDRLRALGHAAWLRPVAGPPAVEGLPQLAMLERRLYRQGHGGGESGLSDEAAPAGGGSDADLVIDACGGPREAGSAPCLVMLADGAPGEGALVAALLDGRAPELTVARVEAGGLVLLARGLPALEEPHRIIRSLDRVCARFVDLAVIAVEAQLRGAVSADPVSGRSVAMPGRAALAGAALRRLGARLQERVQSLGAGPMQWRIGWRRAAGGSLLQETLAWPAASFEILPDDGARYYADPFLFPHEGRLWLFCEEFPYATGKGLISVVEMGPQGPVGTPKPLLEESCHLSYPQVFAHGGEIYMVPETSARGTIELWRAEQMPDHWVKVATLVEGVVAADATILRHGDLWWLFAATEERGQSSWDCLSLFFAPALEGPWTAHAGNPVIIDARAARPAGRMFMRGPELWRPVQDCSAGYGSALAFARVTRLTPDAYAQEVGPSLRPLPGWKARGAHTLDAAAGVEVIDVLARAGQRLPAP